MDFTLFPFPKSKEQIIEAIEKKKVSVPGHDWRVGITNDPGKGRTTHKTDGKDTTHWTKWCAKTLPDAREIERLCIEKGMAGGTGGDLGEGRTFVYIF